MPKQTTDHCPANDKVLETKEDSTVTYISCEKALAILESQDERITHPNRG